jgi:hypothetical protein
MPTDTPLWCEVWIQTNNDEEAIGNAFSEVCTALGTSNTGIKKVNSVS